jgi:hypothetical protein
MGKRRKRLMMKKYAKKYAAVRRAVFKLDEVVEDAVSDGVITSEEAEKIEKAEQQVVAAIVEEAVLPESTVSKPTSLPEIEEEVKKDPIPPLKPLKEQKEESLKPPTSSPPVSSKKPVKKQKAVVKKPVLKQEPTKRKVEKSKTQG